MKKDCSWCVDGGVDDVLQSSPKLLLFPFDDGGMESCGFLKG